MPELTVVVSATQTDVGKTHTACALARELRRQGLAVCARKPVQSFAPGPPTDAELLARATGEPPERVCPPHRSYPLPLAPPMAARRLGLPPPRLSELVSGLDLPERGVALVEGVGGPRSPLADDGDTVDLAAAVGADLVVIVAEPGLGTISSTLLAAGAFSAPVVVFLNRFDPADDLHRDNREWLAGRCGLAVTATVKELAKHLVSAREVA